VTNFAYAYVGFEFYANTELSKMFS